MKNILVKVKDKIYLAIDPNKSVGKTKYGLKKIAETNRFETIATIGDVEYGAKIIITARPTKNAKKAEEKKEESKPLPKPEVTVEAQSQTEAKTVDPDFPF